MNAPSWDLKVFAESDVMVLRVRGDLDAEGARQVLDLAASIAADSRQVQIDLDGIDFLDEDAATLLLFRQTPWRQLPGTITLRTGGRRSREAVLRAYARRRARSVANG